MRSFKLKQYDIIVRRLIQPSGRLIQADVKEPAYDLICSVNSTDRWGIDNSKDYTVLERLTKDELSNLLEVLENVHL